MLINIKIIPRSSKNEVVGKMTDGKLKIKLTAPPVDGKANDALIKLLSEHYKVNKSQIKITRGRTNQIKLVEISDFI